MKVQFGFLKLMLAASALAIIPNGAANSQQDQVRCVDCWAQIASTGAITRSSNAVSATRLSTGQFEVRFAHNILGCVWQGNVARPQFDNSPPRGLISITGRAGTTDGVFVQTFDQAGTPRNLNFSVFVAC
jgi:hypothetical protein